MDKAEFEDLFHDEHRSILEDIEHLVERLDEETNPDIVDDVQQLNERLGPHFRYEEEALYPSLRDKYGRIYVKRLYDSHEGTIHTVRKLKQMSEEGTINNRKALDSIYGWIFPHVSDCEGLSIMVDQIPEEALDEIVKARERAYEDNLDLLTWANETREQPEFGTLTIFN